MPQDKLPPVRNQSQFRGIVDLQRKNRRMDLRPVWKRVPEVLVIGLIVAAAWANAGRVLASIW
jgi:hypothetical protein